MLISPFGSPLSFDFSDDQGASETKGKAKGIIYNPGVSAGGIAYHPRTAPRTLAISVPEKSPPCHTPD
jgi:hypothetical protein